MNILITGASGFIGSVLLRKLILQKHRVAIILRKEANTWRINDLLPSVDVYRSDLTSANVLKKIVRETKPTIIYHLAAHGAYSYQDNAERILHINIFGTWNLLQACRETNYDLFVNTGSSSEYGFKSSPMRETDLLEPASYYAVTKCAQTLLCRHMAKEEKRPIVTLRPFSVYGPYEEPTRFIPTLMKSLLLTKKMDLVAPTVARDYIYVDDMVDAYVKIDTLKKNPGECFNIGTGVQSTTREVVDTTVHVTGKTTTFQWGHMKNRAWDTKTWVADRTKAKKLLRWTPKTPLREGLKKTWAWFQKNSHYYV